VSDTACQGPKATLRTHTLADMVRTDAHQLRPVAGDTPEAEAVKVVARAHKTLIWERTRHTQRLRHQLREYFPAALEAFDDLSAEDRTAQLGSQACSPDQGGGSAAAARPIARAVRTLCVIALHRFDLSCRARRKDTPRPS